MSKTPKFVERISRLPGVFEHLAAHRHNVTANDRVLGIGQRLGQLGVGCQQQQAGRREIQPSDGDQSVSVRAEKIEDSRAPFGISPCRHAAAWLVKRDRAPGARRGPSPRDDNDVALRRDGGKWIGDPVTR